MVAQQSIIWHCNTESQHLCLKDNNTSFKGKEPKKLCDLQIFLKLPL